MWDLIKTNFSQRRKLLYFFNAVIILYLLGVSLGSRFAQLLPTEDFLPKLGTASDIVVLMSIILAAMSFASRSAKSQISQASQEGSSRLDLFWSKIITLIIQYVDLIIIDAGFAFIFQALIFKGKYDNFHSIYIMAIAVCANALYVFLLGSVTILFSTFAKSAEGALVAGLGFRYLGTIIAGGFMILLYHHRWLKWNPFNCLFVGGSEGQITDPMYHAMTKMTMPDVILSAIVYSLIYLFFAYLIFERSNQKFNFNHK